VEWANLAAAWFAAVGTVGALVIALTIFARENGARRRAQAERVNYWMHGQHVVIGNATDGVIYRLVAERAFWQPDEPESEWRAEADHVRPGGEWETSVILPAQQGFLAPSVFLVALTFSDSAGRRWRRQGAALLLVHDPNPAWWHITRRRGQRERERQWRAVVVATEAADQDRRLGAAQRRDS
jgi:hypothetical protein